MTNELIPVTLWLAGRSYRIRIKHEDEHLVRQAAKQAEEKIIEMRSQYDSRDDQDFLAMVLLSYAIDIANKTNNDPVLLNNIQLMTDKIDKAISKN